MKKLFVFLFISLAAGVWADADITIQRARSNTNAGFKERVYIDGRQVLILSNGDSGTVRVSSGNHVIHAELYTLITPKLAFSAGAGSMIFTITPYSTRHFVVEMGGGGGLAQPGTQPPGRPSQGSGGVEGSLERAVDKIMEKIPPQTHVAIVYVTADDNDVAEFIAGEMEFFIVENKRIVVDRSQLDLIRQEQRLQMSGEVDDRQAVNIGKLAGAGVIITGAVNGSGDLRRLRLRALDTQTAQVLSVASEKY